MFYAVLHGVRSNCVASMDLLAIRERQFLLRSYAGFRDSTNFSTDGYIVRECQARIGTASRINERGQWKQSKIDTRVKKRILVICEQY